MGVLLQAPEHGFPAAPGESHTVIGGHALQDLQPMETTGWSREQCKGDGASEESCHTLTTTPVLTLCAARDGGKGSGTRNEGQKLSLGKKGERSEEGVLIFALYFSPSNTFTNRQ